MRLSGKAAAVFVAFFAFTDVHAEGLALGAKISSLGLGLDLTARASDGLNLRAGFNFFSYSIERQQEDVVYEGTLTLSSYSFLADLYPARGGSFRLTGGVLYDRNEVEATARPSATVTINGVPYSSGLVGSLHGRASASRQWAPYLGLGFGNAVSRDRRLGAALDLGVLFHGSARVDLSADGVLSYLPSFLFDLAAEEAKINADLDRDLYHYYPVLALRVSYQF